MLLMKKVGIASCIYQNNYGSILQAYATKEYLNSIGYDCEFINYQKLDDVKKKRKMFFASQIFRWEYFKEKLPLLIQKFYIKTVKNSYTLNIRKRHMAFDEFRREFFNTSPAFSNLNLLSDYVDNNYYAVIVGSDQLWLPVNVVAGFYSLNFVNKNKGIKKVSFATSLGQSFIPKELIKYYQKFLMDFDFISVREKNGADIISELRGQQVDVISDPVFLLSKEMWLKLLQNEGKSEKKYVLCYFLGNGKGRFKRIHEYCKNNKLEMFAISNEERRCFEEEICDKVYYSASPLQFIDLINGAELVCTDSFHCIAFSIILNKKFVPFMRYSQKNKYSTNGRIVELLTEFEYELMNSDNKEFFIGDLVLKPTEAKDRIINKRKIKADEFMRKALDLND
jgi:hypothetical protein